MEISCALWYNSVGGVFMQGFVRLIVTVVSAVVIFGLIWLGFELDIPALTLVLVVVCSYFGYIEINRLFGPRKKGALRVILRFIFALMLGTIFAPIRIGKMVGDMFK